MSHLTRESDTPATCLTSHERSGKRSGPTDIESTQGPIRRPIGQGPIGSDDRSDPTTDRIRRSLQRSNRSGDRSADDRQSSEIQKCRNRKKLRSMFSIPIEVRALRCRGIQIASWFAFRKSLNFRNHETEKISKSQRKFANFFCLVVFEISKT